MQGTCEGCVKPGFARRFREPRTAPGCRFSAALKHIYAQVIDDTTGRTIVAASSQETLKATAEAGSDTKTDVSSIVGRALAERALAAGVTRVVFDRGGCKYHGRVKALADGSREGGLQF